VDKRPTSDIVVVILGGQKTHKAMAMTTTHTTTMHTTVRGLLQVLPIHLLDSPPTKQGCDSCCCYSYSLACGLNTQQQKTINKRKSLHTVTCTRTHHVAEIFTWYCGFDPILAMEYPCTLSSILMIAFGTVLVSNQSQRLLG
jgi:hypothetical protein